MGYEVASLGSLITEYQKQNGSLNGLQRAFSSSHCHKNCDEEDFLCNKAVDFELKNKARTYLIFDEAGVAAYFSLAIKTIDLQNVSQSKKKDMLAGETKETYSAFLIGHLAKNDRIKEPLGEYILENALDLLFQAQQIVGGRLVYVDCKDVISLKIFYEKNGFKYFKTSQESGLLQYYKKL